MCKGLLLRRERGLIARGGAVDRCWCMMKRQSALDTTSGCKTRYYKALRDLICMQRSSSPSCWSTWAKNMITSSCFRPSSNCNDQRTGSNRNGGNSSTGEQQLSWKSSISLWLEVRSIHWKQISCYLHCLLKQIRRGWPREGYSQQNTQRLGCVRGALVQWVNLLEQLCNIRRNVFYSRSNR